MQNICNTDNEQSISEYENEKDEILIKKWPGVIKGKFIQKIHQKIQIIKCTNIQKTANKNKC